MKDEGQAADGRDNRNGFIDAVVVHSLSLFVIFLSQFENHASGPIRGFSNRHLGGLGFIHDNGTARADGRAGTAQVAFGRKLGSRLLHHDPLGTDLHTGHASGAQIRVHPEDAEFQDDGVDGAVIGADAALITELNPVIPRCGKTTVDMQQRPGGLDHAEILHGTGQPTGTATRAVFVDDRCAAWMRLP